MALGVYKISNHPMGPDFEKNIYTKRPTITGGNDIKEFIKTRSMFFPINSFVAIRLPKGKLIKHEITKANNVTFRDKKTISITLGSKLIINLKAISKALNNSNIYNNSK